MRLISYRETTFSASYSYKHISCLISRPVTALYTSQSSSVLWPQTFSFSDGNTIRIRIDLTSIFTLKSPSALLRQLGYFAPRQNCFLLNLRLLRKMAKSVYNFVTSVRPSAHPLAYNNPT